MKKPWQLPMRHIGSCAFVSLLALWHGQCGAAPDESSDRTLREVTVTDRTARTASLREENSAGSRLGISALETPATVQTVTAEEMSLRGDLNIVDAVKHSTGVTASPTTGGGGYGYVVRGFGTQSVTVLYDGIKSLSNIGNASFPYDAWNVDRVEILSGPASVLYGAGAVGAAMNVVPRKPSRKAENTLRLIGGSFDTYGVALDSTGAISKDLLYRLDLSHNQSDGYVHFGKSYSSALSGALTWLAADNLHFTLSVDYAKRQPMYYGGTPLIDGAVRKSLRKANYATYDTRDPFEDLRVTLATEWQPSSEVKVRNLTYLILGDRLWRYPGSVRYRPATRDILRSNYASYDQQQKQIGNHTEVAVEHTFFGLKSTTSVGADIDHMTNERLVDNYPGSDVLDLYNSHPGYFPSRKIGTNYGRMRARQLSLFAENKLELLPRLSLVTGARKDYSRLTRDDLINHTSVDKKFTPLSWRVGAVYQLAEQFNLYGQYSKAVDMVSSLPGISAANLDYAMSEGKQTEIGLKQIAFDNRLEWTLAAYHIVKNRLLTPDPVNPGVSLQVGQQSSRGIEASVKFRPAPNWLIEANGTVLRAKYDDFSERVSGVLVSRNGNRPGGTPQRLANLLVSWGFAPGWTAIGSVSYTGDRYANTANTVYLPGYTIAGLGLRWAMNRNTTLDLRARNIFNKTYAYAASSGSISYAAGSTATQWILGEPRAFYATLTTKF